MLRFYNYLTRKKEKFTPINPPAVGLYTCGPTVYDFAHIGNLRTYLFEDLLRRTLAYNEYEVNHIMNITDVEDKIIKRARREKVDFRKITKRYTEAFFEDLKKLNVLPAESYPTVTDHINEIIELVSVLIKKGFAYQSEEGSVYFDISKFADYGRLAQLSKQDLQKGAGGSRPGAGRRILADEYEKGAVGDFALWKAKLNPTGLEVGVDEPGWDSPWGKGRPGWHIECSALSMKYLGEHFDIHAGAVDLIFPHHTNEIAQSEAASGEKFVNYWLEGEHLLVGSEKMAKSRNNYYTLRDIEKRGFDPLAFRYLALQTHYRQKLNFTWESLGAAQAALTRLRREIFNFQFSIFNSEQGMWRGRCAEYEQKFFAAINDDLGIPQALALGWDLIKSDYPARLKLPTLLKFDEVWGLKLAEVEGRPGEVEMPEEVQRLVKEREELRQKGEFEKADQLRRQIRQKGFEIEDSAQGPRLKRSCGLTPQDWGW